MMTEQALRQMIESAVRMSLETLRLQQQMQIQALRQQIVLLETQVQRLQAAGAALA